MFFALCCWFLFGLDFFLSRPPPPPQRRGRGGGGGSARGYRTSPWLPAAAAFSRAALWSNAQHSLCGPLCHIIYLFRTDCNFLSTLGAAAGLLFRRNRPTAAAQRASSTTHTGSATPAPGGSPKQQQPGLWGGNCQPSPGSEECHSVIPRAPGPRSISAQLHGAP